MENLATTVNAPKHVTLLHYKFHPARRFFGGPCSQPLAHSTGGLHQVDDGTRQRCEVAADRDLVDFGINGILSPGGNGKRGRTGTHLRRRSTRSTGSNVAAPVSNRCRSAPDKADTLPGAAACRLVIDLSKTGWGRASIPARSLASGWLPSRCKGIGAGSPASVRAQEQPDHQAYGRQGQHPRQPQADEPAHPRQSRSDRHQ